MKITEAHGEFSPIAKPIEARSSTSSGKIERLRAALRDGSFRIDFDMIARRLMGEDEP